MAEEYIYQHECEMISCKFDELADDAQEILSRVFLRGTV